MIYFKFSIKNPFHNEKKNPWKNYFQDEKQISEHKVLEYEFSKYMFKLFDLELETSFTGCDHAGPKFTLTILGYTVSVGIYDTRHWHFDEERWMNYDEVDNAD